MLPCGLWQTVQPSRIAGCSKTKGRVCSRWHWAQVSLRRAMASPLGRFEDVAAMRVMALHAIHLFLRHRVVLGKLKFRLLLAMALETSRGVFAGIDDEFASPAAARDVQARGSVARFAARLPCRARVFEVDSGVGAGGKDAGDAPMAIGAGLVADERRARNGGRRECRQPASWNTNSPAGQRSRPHRGKLLL